MIANKGGRSADFPKVQNGPSCPLIPIISYVTVSELLNLPDLALGDRVLLPLFFNSCCLTMSRRPSLLFWSLCFSCEMVHTFYKGGGGVTVSEFVTKKMSNSGKWETTHLSR